ncbi:MAG: ethanolamine permease [Rhodospirillales bacterium]|nr:ethanolamine permease [Rhodospirillales bacterium]
MTDSNDTSGVHYAKVGDDYFAKRGLRRHARLWSLWALGVGAVISGDFSGWNLGLAPGGFGGLLIATAIITVMYLGLCFSLAEMSPALPHTGGAYSFARTAMGPWGGFVTGLAENLEFVLTPAVIVFFISTYLEAIFNTGPSFQPIWWIASYVLFVALNIVGVELSFRISVVVTVSALAILAVFWVSAIPHFSLDNALNIPPTAGNSAFLPFGWAGMFASLPFAVWFFLAIEQLPLSAEEAHDPKRDMPRGLIFGILTLIACAYLTLILNTGVAPGAAGLSESGEPLLDGFRTIYGQSAAKGLALIAVVGLVASFHSIIFAYGRQIYSLSRAGYFPSFLSLTHGQRKTPYVALITGAVMGLAVLLIARAAVGAEKGGAFVGGALLNMAVFGAMLSYMLQAMSFILLRQNLPLIERPYRSPFGIPGAAATFLIAALTLYFQLTDPVYQQGVFGAAIWYALGLLYFALIGRHKLVRSPEEEFALRERARAARAG